MARQRGSWYFEGYQSEIQLDDKGREKRVLVYRGEWYGLGLEPTAYRRCKLTFLGLTVLLTALYLLINFFPSEGGMTSWVGAPCLLVLVPLIFLWIGLVNFLPAKEKWELRVFYAGYRRMYRWTIVTMVLLVVTAAAELVFLVSAAQAPLAELPYLLGLAACLLCAAGILLLVRLHPAEVVQGPEVR